MSVIGFVVNPYAGMGGVIGLKGTDGCVDIAMASGSPQISPSRALQFLSSLTDTDHSYLTAAGSMGGEELIQAGITDLKIVYTPRSKKTTPDDTRNTCRAMMEQGAELMVFCGGDGTARDVFAVIGQDIPMLGIPAGVKMYSGVFATTPRTAAVIVSGWRTVRLRSAEVMDIDEEQYRAGILSSRLYGIAQMPYIPELCQACKQVSFGDEDTIQQDIARFISSLMRDDTLYLLGAGSTTKAISDHLNLPSTLLGIDAVRGGRIVALDLNEQAILDLLRTQDTVKIILSPIGAQGFVLGRGNQQISSTVLKKTGTDALIVVATPAKLQQTPLLYIDSGDPDLNQLFGDYIQVICGDHMAQRKKLLH